MAKKYSAFSYKQGNSFVHKMPAAAKILLIPLISILFFRLPPVFPCGLILAQFVLSCALHFSLREQFSDLKPVIYYGLLLYAFNAVTCVLSGNGIRSVLTDYATLLLLVRLFCVMQSASIMFKTSTSLEIREGIGQIEDFVRKLLHLKKSRPLTDILSRFICFIPLVYKIWEQLKLSWRARQGKPSVRMYITLLPVLFSVGMKQAYNSARATFIREIQASGR